jgi:S-adenosylhomocysteine hydrolase
MRRLVLLLLVLLGAPAGLRAQAPVTALDALHPMLGEWQGTGWQLTPAGQRAEASITERAELRLSGGAIVVEGLGRVGDRVVHSALGVITREAATGIYRMRAFRADGHMVDTVIEIGEGSYQWGFEDPRAGRIRYTVRFSADTWEEEGEISRDGGTTWMPFMAMTLKRVS